jgi:hypothetical protein
MAEIDVKTAALKNNITHVKSSSDEYKEICSFVTDSHVCSLQFHNDFTMISLEFHNDFTLISLYYYYFFQFGVGLIYDDKAWIKDALRC